MRINTKLIIIGILMAAILGLSLVVLFKRKDSNRESTSNKESPEDSEEEEYVSQIEYCLPSFEENTIIGEWLYFGGEASSPPYIVFSKDRKFTLYDWVEEGYLASGEWKYLEEKGAIKLMFYELDRYWEDLLNDDPKQYFDGVVEYDIDKKEIAFKLGYFERSEDFTGECKGNRFYIDLFNLYLYKP